MIVGLAAMIGPALDLICQIVAAGIGGVQINRLETHVVAGRTLIRKRRTQSSGLLIALGNFVFRFRQPLVRVLPTDEWIEWERIVGLATRCRAHDDDCLVGSGLVSEKIPGEPLTKLLQTLDADYVQKRAWVKTAACALQEFHRQTFLAANQTEIQLSHADATITNVLIDCSTGQATWFDFDLRHDLDAAASDRQADDLRALLFSTVACCEWGSIEDLVSAVREGYENSRVWNTLTEQVSRTQFRYDLLHLAQLKRAQGACSKKILSRQILELKMLLAASRTMAERDPSAYR